MQIVCPKCGQAVSGADIDLARNVAVCRPCGEVFALPLPSTSTAMARAEPDSFVPPRPEEMRIVERDDPDGDLSIELRPSRWQAIPLLGFATLWCGFLVVWYALLIHSGFGANGPGIIGAVFPLGHVAVGVFVMRKALGQLLNVTRISLGRGGLSVRTRPIQSGRALSLPFESIVRFAVRDTPVLMRNQSTLNFEVVGTDGVARLAKIGLTDPMHMHYLVARLNEALEARRQPPQLAAYR